MRSKNKLIEPARILFINVILVCVATAAMTFLITKIFFYASTDFLYGIPISDVSGMGINLAAFFKWLWIFFPLWLIGSYHVENLYHSQLMTLIRYGNRFRWYKALFQDCLSIFLAYFIPLCLLQIANAKDDSIWPAVLIGIHALVVWLIALLVKEITHSGVISIIAILMLEAMIYVTGEELHLSPVMNLSAWSMYSRSHLYLDGRGFNVWLVVVVQIIACFVICMFIYRYNREKHRYHI